MKLTFAKPALPTTGTLVVFAFDKARLSPSATTLDKTMKGGLKKALKAANFKGGKSDIATLLAPTGTNFDRVVVMGLGVAKEVDDLTLQNAGGTIVSNLKKSSAAASVGIDEITGCDLTAAVIAAEMALGAKLGSYTFDKYHTTKKDEGPTLKSVAFHCEGNSAATRAYGPKAKVADGVFMTRDLVSEPANIIYPESFTKEIKTLTKLGVKVTVLDEKKMKSLGMGAILGVAQGSAHKPRMVMMEWNGGAKGKAPVAFVGKGVTFDTGGISIKPSGGMEDMKWDMGGAGVVTGLMKALAGRKAKTNVIGVVGLVENMPSGTAQRPGDVVTSMSGQTIEVLNTDAEGRLVLADALWYAKETYKPHTIVDLATLTGAILVALGSENAGLFSNNDDLCDKLTAASKAVDEGIWRLPLSDAYDKLINSSIADMQNIGADRWAGSITAAQFLQRFVGDTAWAHLDIAGVTWSKKGKAIAPKGGTGFGVRLLDRLVADNYEK